MATKKEISIEERFVNRAVTPSFGKTVFGKLVKAEEDGTFMYCTLDQLLAIPGIGRQAALLIMDVACDLAGKK